MRERETETEERQKEGKVRKNQQRPEKVVGYQSP